MTNFVAPFLLLALGWQGTALVYASVLAATGLGFILLARPDPQSSQRRAEAMPLAQQLAPLAEMRVWRFSLYYFFVFGAFIAWHSGCPTT